MTEFTPGLSILQPVDGNLGGILNVELFSIQENILFDTLPHLSPLSTDQCHQMTSDLLYHIPVSHPG